MELTGPEISAYAYERTLMMEDRAKFLKELQLSTKEKRALVSNQLFFKRNGGNCLSLLVIDSAVALRWQMVRVQGDTKRRVY